MKTRATVPSEIKLEIAYSLMPDMIVWVIAGNEFEFIVNMQHVYQDNLQILRWNTLHQISMHHVKWALISGLSLHTCKSGLQQKDSVLQAQAKPCTTWWYAIMTCACLYIVYIFKYLLVQQGDLKEKKMLSLCIYICKCPKPHSIFAQNSPKL